MSFVYAKYLPVLLLIVVAFCFISFKSVKKYFAWIEDNWFFVPKKRVKLAQYLYILGFSMLVLGLLDLRGPEQNITSKSSDAKTIILIDTSASMLAEDIRPNRLEKAIMLAKHYVKKAVGQQISVMVFSDNAKKLVPFTKDINLLEARIDSLKTLDLNRGGSGLRLAIQEAIGYFVLDSKEVPMGNMLIISDAEEFGDDFKLNIPDTISVAFVGVGTSNGSTIPLRDTRGNLIGPKKFKGEPIVSKLDEENIKSLAKQIKHYDYWIATTYSIPTDEILRFFQTSLKGKLKDSSTRVRPVYANRLLIPALGLILLSLLLKLGRNFYLPACLVLSLVTQAFAQNILEPEPPKKSEEIIKLEEQLKKGKLDSTGRKYLAEKYLREGFPQEASTLYDETLTKKLDKSNLIDHFNKGSAQLQSGKLKQGLDTNVNLFNYLEKDKSNEAEQLKKMVSLNILKALEQQQSQQNKEEQEQQENQDKKEDQQEGQGQSSNSGQQNKEQKKDQGQKSDKKDKDQNQGNEKKDQDRKDKQGQKDKNQSKGNEKDKEEMVDKEKLPALLKQLLSDDNKLQKQLIEADTKQNKKDQKDW